jgi:hypothetical protein
LPEQPHSLPVKGDKDVGAKPASFMSNNAVGEVSAGIHHGQTGLTFALPIRRRIASAISVKGTR